MSNACRPDTRPAETVRSGIWAMCQWVWLSPAPNTRTGRFLASRAREAPVTTSAPPPSVTRQQSRRRSGSQIIRDDSTSSMDSGSRDHAFGLSAAHRRAATAISASCADVVPYSCICRAAIRA